jgi:hypothetical protein
MVNKLYGITAEVKDEEVGDIEEELELVETEEEDED